MYCLNVITDDLLPLLGRLLESLARYLFFFIGKFIYGAIRYVYNIFVTLCNGRILDNDSIMALFSRIGVILGVIMLFVVSFSVIQLLVDPDAIADKEKGIQNIVKKVIFVIIMLGVSGYVFNILTEVQAIVIERDIIPRLLLPKAVSTENVGGNLSAELFMIFYQVNVDPPGDGCDETYRDETKVAIADDDWDYVPDCLIKGDGEDYVFYMEYNWLFSTLFGIAALYMIFSYCITVGVRLIQLTFLQIISPAAIIGYLSPKKDNIFSKWIKIYFSTYIDVFIRIAIINFAMYLIALIMDGWQNQTTGFWASVGSPGLGTKGFIAAIMIMAILQFAKKAPELLKKLLPAGESGLGFGVGGEGALAGIGALAGFGVGAVGRLPGMIGNVNDAKGLRGKAGALAAGLGGISLGGLTGIARGGHAGYGSKGLGSAITGGGSAQGKANLARAQRISSGVGLGRYYGNKALNAIGIETGDDRMDNQLKKYNEIISYHKEAKSEAESEILKNAAHYSDGWYSLAELNVMRNDQNLSVQDRVDAEDRYNKLLKNATNYTFDTGNIVTDGYIEFNHTTGTTDTSYIRGTEANSTVSSRIGVLGGTAAAAKAQKDNAQDKINEIQTSERYRNRISGQK